MFEGVTLNLKMRSLLGLDINASPAKFRWGFGGFLENTVFSKKAEIFQQEKMRREVVVVEAVEVVHS